MLAAGVGFRGFSFHVGSQGSAVEPYRTALRTTIDLAEHLQLTLGVTTTTIDIGGGFPVDYREEMPDIAAIGAEVTAVLGDDHPYTVLAEPGRFLSAGFDVPADRCRRHRRPGRPVWHYLDDGLYGAYSNIMTEDVHPPILALKELATTGRAPTWNPSRWPDRPATVSTSSHATIRCRRCAWATSSSAP